MAVQNFDVAVVGHFALDTISLLSRSSPFLVLGGSVTYVSLVAKRLDTTVSIISKVGEDFPEAYMWLLREEGINLSGVTKLANKQTTSFELGYSKNLANRTLKLKSKAPRINVSDLPRSLQAKAVHVAPIAGEISYKVVEKLKSCAEVLSLDPQGLLRSVDKAGNVTPRSRVDKRLFGLINIYKSSLDEITALCGKNALHHSPVQLPSGC
jgi:sugar/nucleoside kinase (ribokinase family)